MADWITSLKVVDHNAQVCEYSTKKTSSDTMNAVKVSMGVFGVVVEMTLKVKPTSVARVQNLFPSVGELFYAPNPDLLTLLNDHWSVQCLWFPFNSLDLLGGIVQGLPFPCTNIWQPKTDEVWVRAIDKVDTCAETNRLLHWQ